METMRRRRMVSREMWGAKKKRKTNLKEVCTLIQMERLNPIWSR
jgi:hypothetical protein